MRRYIIELCDNHGTIDGRDRTWLVLDRANNRRCVADLNTRTAARREAVDLNAIEIMCRALSDLNRPSVLVMEGQRHHEETSRVAS